MKLIVLACLVAAALALPQRRSYRRRQQYEQQAYVEPETYEQPQPRYEQPQPRYEQPQPTYEKPQPSYEEPQPSYEKPQPSYSRSVASPKELSASRRRDRDSSITSFTNEQTSDGGSKHSFTTDNGLQRQETIELREVYSVDENGNEVVTTVPVFSGSFEFLHDDGTVAKRSYTTDETGHLIWSGNDLPKAPQVPRSAPQEPQAAAYQ